MDKKPLFLDSYFDFDSTFPMEYFEIYLLEAASKFWIVCYVNDEIESSYGPFPEKDLLNRLTLAPFHFDEMVLIYHLVENPDTQLKDLGVRLLRQLI